MRTVDRCGADWRTRVGSGRVNRGNVNQGCWRRRFTLVSVPACRSHDRAPMPALVRYPLERRVPVRRAAVSQNSASVGSASDSLGAGSAIGVLQRTPPTLRRCWAPCEAVAKAPEPVQGDIEGVLAHRTDTASLGKQQVLLCGGLVTIRKAGWLSRTVRAKRWP